MDGKASPAAALATSQGPTSARRAQRPVRMTTTSPAETVTPVAASQASMSLTWIGVPGSRLRHVPETRSDRAPEHPCRQPQQLSGHFRPGDESSPASSRARR